MQRTKDDILEILFYDKNQVDHKIVWGLGVGFLNIHSRSNAYQFICI